MTTLRRFEPDSAEVKADPYPTYTWLRRDAPVYHDAQHGWWVLSRYADVAAALRNHTDFSSAEGISAERDRTRMMISTDPPDHTLLRSLVNKAFTPRMVAGLEPRIRQITDTLLGDAMTGGRFDLARDLAMPLPMTVIAEMLGVEAERREDFKRWSNAFVGSGERGTAAGGGNVMEEFSAYFGTMIEARRAERRDDLLSALVAAQEDRAALSTGDILWFCLLLLVAGNETTTNLLTNSALALFQFPEQMALLRDNPARIPMMVEEALRYDAPVQGLFRTTTRDLSLHGFTIPADSKVMLLYAAANRDAAAFPDPDRFDILRADNNHLAFGYGIHFCLGAPLARLEARVAWEELLRRTADLRLDPERPVVRVDNPIVRGLVRLPMRFIPA